MSSDEGYDMGYGDERSDSGYSDERSDPGRMSDPEFWRNDSEPDEWDDDRADQPEQGALYGDEIHAGDRAKRQFVSLSKMSPENKFKYKVREVVSKMNNSSAIKTILARTTALQQMGRKNAAAYVLGYVLHTRGMNEARSLHAKLIKDTDLVNIYKLYPASVSDEDMVRYARWWSKSPS